MDDKPISGLPAITNLDPTDLIAAVHQGITGHAQLSTLLALMFSNIKVVENENGVSVRIPTSPSGGIQICYHLHEFYPDAASFSHTSATPWPQTFASGVEPIVFLSGVEGSAEDNQLSIVNARAARYIYRRRMTRADYRFTVYAQTGDTLDSAKLAYTSVLGIGRY